MKRTPYITCHWYDLIDGTVKPKDANSQKWYALVRSAHSEGQRHYHTLEHLRELFEHFDRLENRFQNPKRILAAIFFHDIVYHTRRDLKAGLNEKKSAQIAKQALLEIGFDAAFVNDVASLIRCTADHKINAMADPDGVLFIDMDMAILGANKARYLEYTDQIHSEYKNSYSQEELCGGRLSRFVEPTLKTERIFHTSEFHTQYEAQARANLTMERDILRKRLAALQGRDACRPNAPRL